MEKCDLSSKHYMEILTLLRTNGYRFIFYKDHRNNNQINEKLVILRHDIDQSIEAAYHMAQTEYEQGVKSTYFVWLTSPFYNILDPTKTKILKKILDLGHDIGLHFDPTAYTESMDLSEKLQMEAAILAKVINYKISSFSFHRPSKQLLLQNLQIKGLINSYDKTFFEEFKYISDSNHHWREGCACNHIQNNKLLHILTHPIWWNYNHLHTQNDKLHKFKEELNEKMTAELSKNVKGFKELHK